MNNSEIIAALSIALTAIIFLLQSDDGLLKVKFKSVEKWYILRRNEETWLPPI